MLPKDPSRRHRAGPFILAVCMLSAGWMMAVSAAAATHTIVMEGVAFTPEKVTVRQGDTVVWVNRDPFPHTATALDRTFDSGEMGPDKRWEYTARKKGRVGYVCTLHPTMKGVLVVE